jgi:hypothetical protein
MTENAKYLHTLENKAGSYIANKIIIIDIC